MKLKDSTGLCSWCYAGGVDRKLLPIGPDYPGIHLCSACDGPAFQVWLSNQDDE